MIHAVREDRGNMGQRWDRESFSSKSDVLIWTQRWSRSSLEKEILAQKEHQWRVVCSAAEHSFTELEQREHSSMNVVTKARPSWAPAAAWRTWVVSKSSQCKNKKQINAERKGKKRSWRDGSEDQIQIPNTHKAAQSYRDSSSQEFDALL